MKARSKEEVEAILKDMRDGMRVAEVCQKHGISETSLYRVLALKTGSASKGYEKRQESRIARLERELAERDKEIRLMKAALKKSSR